MSHQNIEMINVDQILLDTSNPRLPNSFKNKRISQDDIINWMLEDASIIELMLAIGQSGFFVGESILVVKENECFVAIEGNRRLTSVKLLSKPDIARIHKKRIEKVIDESEYRPVQIPCIVFESRDKINKYLGFRHVTGVKSWGILQKARYLNQLCNELGSGVSFLDKCRQLAKSIGSKSDYVKRLLIAFKVYEVVEDNAFYKINGLDETTIFFNYYSDSLDRENIRKFIQLEVDYNGDIEKVDERNLEELTKWFFEKNHQNKSRIIGDSKNLTMLDKVLGDSAAFEYFRNGSSSLSEAFNLISLNADDFFSEIDSALLSIKRANNMIHNIDTDLDSVCVKLKEISRITKGLNVIIESRKDDEWDA